MLWMRWRENAQTATFSSMLLSLSSSMMRSPSLKTAPPRTSAISSWPLNLRQRAWAASGSGQARDRVVGALGAQALSALVEKQRRCDLSAGPSRAFVEPAGERGA